MQSLEKSSQRDLTLLLPDELLELCFPVTARNGLSALRLVCRRWLRLVDSSPRLSCELTLEVLYHQQHYQIIQDDIAALNRLAARRKGVVRRALLYHAHLPGVLEAARQLTALTCLTLRACEGCRPEPAEGSSYGGALAQLSLDFSALRQLQELQLDVDEVEGASCRQLSALTWLTSLSVGTFAGQVADELWEVCALMPRLAGLAVSAHPYYDHPCHITCAAWEHLAACTQLTTLLLDWPWLEAVGESGVGFVLQPGMTRLASLRTFELLGGAYLDAPDTPGLWTHPGITRLVLDTSNYAPGMPEAAGGVCMPALRHLALLSEGDYLPAYPSQLFELTTITSLQLSAQERDPEAAPLGLSILGELWRFPLLSSLSAALRYGLDSVPEGIQQLTGLRALDLSGSYLKELPDGPYLLALRTLLLEDHRLTRMPASLLSATALEVLDLSRPSRRSVPGFASPSMGSGAAGFTSSSDAALLRALQMPALRVVCVPSTFDPGQLPRSVWLHASLAALARPPLLVESRPAKDLAAQQLLPHGWDGGVDAAAAQALWSTYRGRFLSWWSATSHHSAPAAAALQACLSTFFKSWQQLQASSVAGAPPHHPDSEPGCSQLPRVH